MITRSKTYKRVYWKRSQMRRDAWERKWNILVRNVLNKQFKSLSYRIDVTNYLDTDLPDKIMEREPIEKMITNIYTSVGLAFAKEQFQSLKSESQAMMLKAEEPVDEWFAYLQNYAKTKAGYRITSIAESGREQAKKIIRAKLEQSAIEGWGADKTASAIRKGLIEEGQVINQWRALRIARTEIMTASNQGAMVGAKESDLPLEKYWIATYDSRTRDTHADMEEQNPKDMDEDFQVGDYMMDSPGDPDGGPEEVINCYTGDLKIKSAIIGAQRSFYSGKIIEIITVGGKRITITPNHNILTANGFVRAKDINVGSDLICNTEKINIWDIMFGRGKNINNKKSLVENVFYSLSVFWRIKVRPVVHLDFNNDGKFMKGQVDIIDTDSSLPINQKFFIKDFGKFGFKHTRAKASLVKCFCSLNFSFDRTLCASYSFMRFLHLPFSLSRIHITPFNLFTIGLSSYHYSIFNKLASKRNSLDAEFLRYLIQTNSRFIHIDKVSEIRDVDFSGHVYDFTSLTGTNIINNIYTSNCRCTIAFEVKQ